MKSSASVERLYRFLALCGSVILIAIPFVPIEALVGPFSDSKQLLNNPYQWCLSTGIVLGIALILPAPVGTWFARRILALIHSRWVQPLGFLILVVLLFVIEWKVFQFSPLINDETAQILQAKIFASGHATGPLAELPEFFMMQHVIMEGGKVYSQYPPGFSLILAVGEWMSAPWLVNPLLALLTVFFLSRFAALAYDRRTSAAVSLLAVITPFLLFLGASFMNHMTALVGLSFALWRSALWEEKRERRELFLLGMGVGVAFLARPLCAIAGGGAMALYLFPAIYRDVRALVSGALGFLPFVAVLMIFNWLTTGDPFLPGYIQLWGKEHGLGFHRSPWGHDFGPLDGIKNFLINLTGLEEYLFESPIPGLALVGLIPFFWRGTTLTRWDKRLLLFFWSFPVFYIFYWHRDLYLGPRFLLASTLAALPLTVRAADLVIQWSRGKSIVGYPLEPRVVSFLTLTVLFVAGVGIPGRFQIYASGWNSMKQAQTIARALPQNENRLIFVKVSWGARIMAQLRALGASSAATEIAYRFGDACLLQELTDRALNGELPSSALDEELQKFHTQNAQKARVTEDPTLRLIPGRPLSQRCLNEIEYDRQGFRVALPYLILNSLNRSGPLVFAIDLRTRNSLLRTQYPNHSPYILTPKGILPLR